MKVGQKFTDPATQQRWRVTDVRTRTFLAVCLSDPHVEADPSWLNGPPYGVAEAHPHFFQLLASAPASGRVTKRLKQLLGAEAIDDVVSQIRRVRR